MSFYSVLIGALIAIILLMIAATRKNMDQQGAREVFVALILVLVALFFFELSLIIKSEIRFLFHEMKFITLAFLAPFSLFVYLAFSGEDDKLSRTQRLLLCVIPSITVVMALTNSYHHFFRRELYELVYNNVSYIGVTSGWWHLLYSGYSYTLYIAGIIVLAVNYYRRPRIYRNQIGLMILTSTAAVAVSGLAILGPINDYGDIGLVSCAVVCIAQYITLVKYSQKIVVTKARNLVVSHLDSVVLIFDHNDRLIDSNRSDNAIYKALKAGMHTGNTEGELFIPSDKKYYSLSEKKLFDQRGRAIGRVIVLNDITELKTTVNELEHITTHDYLTGLKNRQAFHRELRAIDDKKLPAAFIYVNMPEMIHVNNIFGYEYGDKTIIRLSGELHELTRERESLCARLNGHDFGVILENAGEKEAEEFIRELEERLEDSRVISLETGFMMIRDKSRGVEQLLAEVTDASQKEEGLYAQALPEKFFNFIQNSLSILRDKTGERQKVILRLCLSVAEALELPAEEVERVKLLSLMADIGLLGVSSSIVENIGRLTNDEWEEMKLHTVKGHNIALSVNEISGIAKEILSHHERYDGYGYPLGLKGEDIPLLSRIYSAAEFLSDNPKNARKLLKARSKTQFDPQIVEILLKSEFS